MMGYFCKTCHEYQYTSISKEHACPPAFLVWCRDNHGVEEEGDRIHAYDHSAAAEKWAECDDHDSADYSIVRGSPATVRVRATTGDAGEKWFEVSGESLPSYSARETEPK